MRVAFVAHSHVKKTRSSRFFQEVVLAGHAVDCYWDEEWCGGRQADLAAVVGGKYDLVVAWHLEKAVSELSKHGKLDIVWVPMWDGIAKRVLQPASHDDPPFWHELERVRVVSFSRQLHETMRRLGLPSAYVQYFPNPADFQVVEDFTQLRAFFWQRVRQITPAEISRLMAGTDFDRLHLHLAPDPRQAELNEPSRADLERHRTNVSRWFEDRVDFGALLSRSNVFFAPRPYEGIGMSMLEAMAMGMCVVAPDNGTMNEYVVNGVNGLLWKEGSPRPLDFSRASEMGRRARRTVELGHERWLRDLPRLRAYVETPTLDIAPAEWDAVRFRGAESETLTARLDQRDRLATETSSVAVARARRQGGARTRGIVKRDRSDAPLVTVVTVTLNCASTVEGTIRNVLAQDYPNLEVIVADGGSTDGTAELIQRYDRCLDLWSMSTDAGPYDAMNKAADLANGRWILFMNAGDWFIGEDAISRALRDAPDDADFVIGHHVYRTLEGHEQLHRANDFEETWRRLRAGDLDGDWLGGIPGHQATFTRTALLQKHRYDTTYRIAADHELMYRLRRNGARFHHSCEVISLYASGGFSWQNQLSCVAEWWAIAARYGIPLAAENFFGPMRRSLLPDTEAAAGVAQRAPVAEIAPPLPSVQPSQPPAPEEPSREAMLEEQNLELQARVDRLETSLWWKPMQVYINGKGKYPRMEEVEAFAKRALRIASARRDAR